MQMYNTDIIYVRRKTIVMSIGSRVLWCSKCPTPINHYRPVSIQVQLKSSHWSKEHKFNNTSLSNSIRTHFYLYQYLISLAMIGKVRELISSTILHYQCQSEHEFNFIWINTLLSMSIRTQLYLYQFFTINVNPDTILSVPIPNLYLSFKRVFQDASHSLCNQSGVYFQLNVFWVLFCKLS